MSTSRKFRRQNLETLSTGDGFTCEDINECLRDNGGCDQDAQCINTDGGFRCVCDAGFSGRIVDIIYLSLLSLVAGDGYECEDIDECAEDPSLCPHGDCFNYPGSFRCECDLGFMQPATTEQVTKVPQF